MRLHRLRYFAVLAEELHFGRAAERLAITQPPLSSAIKALEEALGVQLFERTSRHVALTAAGEAYLAEVRAVLERIDRAAAVAQSVAGGQQGRLDIGFAGSMVFRDLPRIVQAFGQRLPDIELHLSEQSSSELIQSLLHSQLDAAFVNVATVPPALDSLPLAADHFVCCLPVDHALAQQDSVALPELAHESFVMFSRAVAPANHDNVIALFQRAGIHPRTRHAARQWQTVVALVGLRLGVALVPASLARAGLPGVRFVAIQGAPHPTVGVLAWRRGADHPALQTLLACAREQVGTGRKKGRTPR